MPEDIIPMTYKNAVGAIKKNKLLLIFSAVFIAGLFAGSFAVLMSPNDSCFGMNSLIGCIFSFLSSNGFWSLFIVLFLVDSACVIAVFITGCNVLGFIFSPLIMLVHGGFAGLLAGCLYNRYALSGIGFFALILLPPLFIMTLCQLFFSAESFQFSLKLWRAVLSDSFSGVRKIFSAFSLRLAVAEALCIVCALLGALLSVLFIGYFSL